ncbi:TetR/AcrR family transcriptional regulator [Streptomyces amakusaensis]|uniref:TetR/AcrR family transcriptional regulator n=1 Tax=Streptomyces amakusaensis TaxID=67271 RepID=A0ABW0ALI2_9ACTN
MPTRPARPRRTTPLTSGSMVATALRVARDEGLAAVSMRRLAEESGVSAMALYRHVTDREDLLIRMLDAVAESIPAPPAAGTPRERLTVIMHGMYEAFRRDPWVVQVLVTEGLASTRVLPVLEGVFAAFADAGLEPARGRDAYALLFSFLFGETLVAHHDRADTQARRMMLAVDPERFPRLREAIAAGYRTGDLAGPRDRERFAAHLDRVLDGVLGPR